MKKKLLMSLFSIAFALAGCSSQNRDVPTDKEYTFTNRELPIAESDAGFTIDGLLNEEPYKKVKPLTLKKLYGTEKGEIAFTAYIGEKGLYIGAKVYDATGTYYNAERPTYYNSGVELYYAVGGSTSILDMYEIDMTVGGKLSFKKRFQMSGFTEWMLPYEEAPIYSVRADGNVYNGECKNYTCELFIPYKAIGLTKKPEEIYLNPCLISTYSNDVNDTASRNYYNFAVEQLSFGNGMWSKPEMMYHFDQNGAVKHELKISVSGNGAAQEEYGHDFVIYGDSIEVFLAADDGNRIQSFQVNGQDVTSSLSISGKKAVYKNPFVQGDISIEVAFEKIPDKAVNITGKLVYKGMDDGAYKDIALRFVGHGTTYDASWNSMTQRFSCSLPIGSYTCEVYSKKDGYTILSQKQEANADMNMGGLSIPAENWGEGRCITYSDMLLGYNKAVLSSESISNASMDNFVYSCFMGAQSSIDEARYYVCSTVFTFTTNDAQSKNLTVQFCIWDHNIIAKFIDGNGTQYAKLLSGISNDAVNYAKKRNGIGLLVEKQNERISLYLENSDGTYAFVRANTISIPHGEGVNLTQVAFSAQDGVTLGNPAVLRGAKLWLQKSSKDQIPRK